MNLAVSLKKSLVGSPMVAAAAYAGVVIVLLAVVASSLIDLFSQRASVAAMSARPRVRPFSKAQR
jgi:general secretion pathway protein M